MKITSVRVLLVGALAAMTVGVAACGGSGGGGSEPVAPAAPNGLVVETMGSAAMLTWTDNSSNEDEFMIERKEGTGAFTMLTTVTFNTISHMDSTIVSGTMYTYRVMASNEAGMSTPSNESMYP